MIPETAHKILDAQKIELKLDRNSSVRRGFVSLTVTTDLDKLVIYPSRKRSEQDIDLIRAVKGNIIIEKVDKMAAEALILKYSK